MDIQHDAQTIRSMIQHENTLINERTNWMLTLEGLLFTASALIWDKSSAVVIVLCLVGLISSISLGVFLESATRAIAKLQQWWKNHIADQNYTGPPIIGLRAEEFTRFEMMLLPHRVMPVLFVVAWLVVAILKFTSWT
jgi:hypothetical protein